MNDNPWKNLTSEQATKILINFLREQNYGDKTSYGYEIYLPNLAMEHLKKEHQLQNRTTVNSWFQQASPVFYNAAWELCRRGILRPGVKSYQEQATADGASGNGYTITDFGREWLREANYSDFVPTEPEAFGKMIAKHRETFGDAFHQKSQEAIRCYGAHAYLACCAMCGAAAESILIKLAINKLGEEETKKLTKQRDFRNEIEKKLLQGHRQFVKEKFSIFNDLLKYWRDTSVHSNTSSIREDEAFTALALLLRLCDFISDNINNFRDETNSN